MMAEHGPVPMDLGNVGAYDTKTTQGDSDTSNDMSYEDVGTIAWKGHKAGKRAGKKGPVRSGPWHRGKGADEWTRGRRDDGGKKGGKKSFKGSKPDWYGDKDQGGNGSKGKGKGKGKGKSETRYCYACGEQGHIGVNCPYRSHRGRVSLEEKRKKNLRVWRRTMTKESVLAQEEQDHQVEQEG